MRILLSNELSIISGGHCPEFDNSCQSAAALMLENCAMPQLQAINQIFKGVILSEDMKDADEDIIKAALIEAIKNASF